MDADTDVLIIDLKRTIEGFQEALAYEARVVEAQCDLKAITGSRRRILDDCVKRMRELALGGWPVHYRTCHVIERELKWLRKDRDHHE